VDRWAKRDIRYVRGNMAAKNIISLIIRLRIMIVLTANSAVLILDRIAVLRTYMPSIVIDRLAWSVGLSVCQSVTL